MNLLLDAILSRRSVGPRHLTGPDLTAEELDLLARAVAAAPDHGRLRPVTLCHVPSEHRAALAEVFAEAAREADPDAGMAKLDAARERAMAGASLLAVIARLKPGHPNVPVRDQWIAVGAALEALLLAAQALGLRAKPLSGKRLGSKAVRRAFSLDADSHLAVFVALGRAGAPARETPRPSVEQILTRWTPG